MDSFSSSQSSWFIFWPNVPKFHVDDATLTRLTHSPTNNTLYCNLAVNMTFRNPNRWLAISYKKFEANAENHGRRFATTEVQGLYFGHKKENNVSSVFKEEHVVFDGVDDQIFIDDDEVEYDDEEEEEDEEEDEDEEDDDDEIEKHYCSDDSE
ncbi:hypothetical protein R6Q59_024035 [Mikania micrantha]